MAMMAIERLGHASFPSGRAVIVDLSLLGGELAQDWPAWAAVCEDVPRGALEVKADRVGDGPEADHWRNVWVELGEGVVASSEFAGVIPIESTRLLFIDAKAIETWDLDNSRDGKADFLFHGKDAASLAKLLDAPAYGEGFGFVDRPIEEVASIAREAAGLLAGRGWAIKTRQAPHTDVHMLVRAAGASSTSSSELELAGTTMCMFVNPWGNGVCKVMLDRNAEGHALRFRLELVPPADGEVEVEAAGDAEPGSGSHGVGA